MWDNDLRMAFNLSMLQSMDEGSKLRSVSLVHMHVSPAVVAGLYCAITSDMDAHDMFSPLCKAPVRDQRAAHPSCGRRADTCVFGQHCIACRGVC